MGDAANRLSQQAHSIHGGMDRGSPQSTLRTVLPVQRSTHFNKRNPQSLNHQPNQHYSQYKFSDNEVSVVLSFRASPNAFAPSAPISLPTKTHPSGEIQIGIQQTSSNGRRCQQAIATSALDTRWYGPWFSPIHSENSPTSAAFHTL
jgi:hypothetical protein